MGEASRGSRTEMKQGKSHMRLTSQELQNFIATSLAPRPPDRRGRAKYRADLVEPHEQILSGRFLIPCGGISGIDLGLENFQSPQCRHQLLSLPSG